MALPTKGNLSEAEMIKLQMNEMKQVFQGLNQLAETCFVACAKDFTTRNVIKSEETCARNCVEKHLSAGQRITQRLLEQQQLIFGAGQPGS